MGAYRASFTTPWLWGARRAIGRLSEARLKPTTVTKYKKAVTEFLDFLAWQNCSTCPAACNGDIACCFDASVGGEDFANAFVEAEQAIKENDVLAVACGSNWPPTFDVAESKIVLDTSDSTGRR